MRESLVHTQQMAPHDMSNPSIVEQSLVGQAQGQAMSRTYYSSKNFRQEWVAKHDIAFKKQLLLAGKAFRECL